MNKVLVEVLLPAADMKFDIFIPADSRMHEVKVLITYAISELSGGKFKGDETSILSDANSGLIFNIDMTVAELGIINGARLMLI